MTKEQQEAIERLISRIEVEMNRSITYKLSENGGVEFYARCFWKDTDELCEKFITWTPTVDLAISMLADVFAFACIASFPTTTYVDENDCDRVARFANSEGE